MAGTGTRKHGPRGYLEYQSFKPWLRDEFSYRCVYCLTRERWCPSRHRDFGVDHVAPQSRSPAGLLDYLNLVLACNECNARKRDVEFPDALRAMTLQEHITWNESGLAIGQTPEGLFLIDLLLLNDPSRLEVRSLILELWNEASQLLATDPRRTSQKVALFEYPTELEDLRNLRPPGGNVLPDGVSTCAFAQREQSALPRFY